MKLTLVHSILAVSISLLAIFWMRAVLLYLTLICIILICSWIVGLLLYIEFGECSTICDRFTSVCDKKQSLLFSSMVSNCPLLLYLSVCE